MKQLEIKMLPELEYTMQEAFNSLSTNLSFCGDDIRCILLTSRVASEGKSTTAMQLMRTAAELGKSVVLVDTDLRRSRLMSTYQITFLDHDVNQHQGLAHYLSGQCEIEDVLYATNIDGAYMVPIGREVDSSLSLLSSKRLEVLLDHLRGIADLIIVDSSPAGTISDALEVAKHCDGAALVVGHGQGHMKELVELKDSIKKANCRVLGVILSQVPMTNYKNRKYYYYRGYRKYNPYYNVYGKEDETSRNEKKGFAFPWSKK